VTPSSEAAMAEHRRRLLVWLGVLGDDDERSGISAAEELDGYLKAARDGRTETEMNQ